MSKRKSLIISIPEPCTEAWNEMLPENDGRFCLSCQKKVIDFSAMSDNEILQALSMAGKGCCGRFETSQLGRVIKPQTQSSAPFLPTALLVTLLGATFPETGKAQQAANITVSATNALNMHVPGHIEGRIIDAATGNGVPRVTILRKGSSTGCISDETGYFSLNITEGGSNGTSVFRISCIGYDEIEFKPDPSYISPYTISLNKSKNILREVCVVTSVPHRPGGYLTGAVAYVSRTGMHRSSWWQRFTHIFHKKEKHNEDQDEIRP